MISLATKGLAGGGGISLATKGVLQLFEFVVERIPSYKYILHVVQQRVLPWRWFTLKLRS